MKDAPGWLFIAYSVVAYNIGWFLARAVYRRKS